ncbi:MAG: FtsX-like permease family protein [Saprospiraceae bacterium]|nr:FtsX-like permease family protein [Candidatus Brachybacter algidus]
MIVLEKRQEIIAILKALGLHDKSISSIFINSGMLLSTLGLFMGFYNSNLFIYFTKTVGIVTIPEGFVVDTYPISLRACFDFIVVGFTVLLIGFWPVFHPLERQLLFKRHLMTKIMEDWELEFLWLRQDIRSKT